jgi:hypothetical protein
MKEITQGKLLSISGTSQRDVENWLVRLPLTTKYKPTVRGRPRLYNRDNVIEITMIARLVRSGFSPRVAVEMVADLFKKWKRGEGKEWVIFLRGETALEPVLTLDGVTPGLKLLEVFDEYDDEGVFYTLVNVGRMLKRIDTLLDEDDA